MNSLAQHDTGYRSLPDAAMSRRDLTREEADALLAHQAVLAECRAFVARMMVMHSGAHHLSSSQLTECGEIADAVSDYARVLGDECDRINAGECES